MNNFITSQIRTIVPIAVGAFISWLALRGVNLDEQAEAGLVVFLTSALQAAYYLVARLIERRRPEWGAWLLGSSAQPVYREPEL